ncbi:hypothetical protein RJ640_026927 [Escallonia rubra]|uniref:Pentatricopeptide repeat-containing protein n=1 Tax=Escallonia rubra TaxID=112253 RepID=A0AA88QX55_9ASTE|nr:hypothetical protein RJ640_026927 [Escallonia rubra]
MRFPIVLPSSKLPYWISRVRESALHDKWADVLSHYREIKQAGIRPTDPSFFHPILKACSTLSFRHGKSIHATLVKQGFESFTSAGNSIMDFYVKSGAFDSAVNMFGCMNSRDSVSWNIIIHGHLNLGNFDEGLWLFMQARVEGFEPNISTLVLILQACRNIDAVNHGTKLHGYLIRSGFWTDTSVMNSALSFYAEGGMGHARKVFDEMSDRDVISWCVMIGGHVQSGEADVALGLFKEMLSAVGVSVDGQTMASAIKACTSLVDLCIGRVIHGFVICRGLDYDVFVGNSLIDMYSKCNESDCACKVFSEMPQKNIVSWNSLLSGFVHNEKHWDALMLFDSMGKAGIEADSVTLVNLLQVSKYFVDPFRCKFIHSMVVRRGHESNELVINSLIDAYAKCNLINFSWELFNRMKRRDTVTWSTMIAGFTHCGMPDEAIAVYNEMNRVHVKVNSVTMLNLLEACSSSAELKRSKWAHGVAIRRGFATEVAVGTAILDMYSSCGEIEATRKAFDQISQKNIVSWSAMVAAYGMNGLARDALAALADMRLHGLKPNPVTTLSVLSACSHGGLIEEGLAFFEELIEDCGDKLRLEHYSCMVDLLGRAGKLDTAMCMMEKIPDRLKPGASAWGALLSACRKYGNSELGAVAASRVLELEPSNSAGYLLASNMYAAGGSWVDAARMRWLVKEKGVMLVAGYSLVHINNRACRFVAGDKRQPFSDETSHVVEQLHECMTMGEMDDEAFF